MLRAALASRARRRRGSSRIEGPTEATGSSALSSSRAIDEHLDVLELLGGQRRGVGIEQRHDGVAGRAIEKRVEQMVERGPTRPMPREGRKEHVARAVDFVARVPFFL